MNEELQAQVKLFKQAMLAVGTILDLPPIKLNVKQYEKTCKEHGIKHIRISRNWHYDGDKIERGVLEASMRLMRRAKKAGLITHNDGVTQI